MHNLPFYPVPIRTIHQNGEWMLIHPNGCIERQAPYSAGPSPAWRIVGAVSYTRNGRGVARVWTVPEILTNPAGIPWKWGKGTQKTHIRDYDHGVLREWRSPAHLVY